MKRILLLIALIPSFVFGQDYTGCISIQNNPNITTLEYKYIEPFFIGNLNNTDCGILTTFTSYTEWETVDTIGAVKSNFRIWIESDFYKCQKTYGSTCEYNPCKTNDSHIVYYQFRVCKITGIQQKRYKTEGQKYVARPLSEYDSTVLKFKEKEINPKTKPLIVDNPGDYILWDGRQFIK